MVKPAASSLLSLTSGGTPKRSSETKYTGVRKRKWGKWVSEIRLPNSRSRIWLGSYDAPEKAAKAFDAAQYCLRGNTAKFNFPQQPPHIPGGRSLHPSQIQAVAAIFANTYDTSSSSSSLSDEEETSMPSSSVSVSQVSLSGDETWPNSPLINLSFEEDDFFNCLISNNTTFDHNMVTSSDTTGVLDFAIYPGFDDYFMPMSMQSAIGDDDNGYRELENNSCDEITYLQGPSFLWNF